MDHQCRSRDLLLCVRVLSFKCAMFHIYVCHHSFLRVPWLFPTRVMIHSCVYHDSFVCVPWLTFMSTMSHGPTQCRSREVISKIERITCVPWLIFMCMKLLHMCAMTCSCVCLDSFLCVPWPLHMCAITCSDVCDHSFLCLPWLIPMFSMTRSYVWRIHIHSYISAWPNQSFMFPYR